MPDGEDTYIFYGGLMCAKEFKLKTMSMTHDVYKECARNSLILLIHIQIWTMCKSKPN